MATGVRLETQIETRLLESIREGRLVILCGAGLSMASPSLLPSATELANQCYDRYHDTVDPGCDPNLRDNLEALADYFVSRGNFRQMFIEQLVPWQSFVRMPNAGHAAIADFLLCRIVVGALSANFDILIERQAWNYGADFRTSLDGDEANTQAVHHAPLLKFHGCAYREPSATVWTKSQLTEPAIRERIVKSRTWMLANLREKDLLVIGFWSDWAYFNDILGRALEGVQPLTVTLVSPSTVDSLKEKAPDLWRLAHADHVAFHHVQQSGEAFLDELRRAFSRMFLRQVLRAGRGLFERMTQAACAPAWLEPPDLAAEVLYDWRRDAEGVIGSPATAREPNAGELLGYFHLLLRARGAVVKETGYRLDGRSIRVVNGNGYEISSLRQKVRVAPVFRVTDVVVCVGARNYNLPDNIARSGRQGDIVRPNSRSVWVDMDQGREMLRL